MSDLSTLKFFATQVHPCSYLDGEEATTLFLDPGILPDRHLHSFLSQHGFRRSGNYLYRPHCQQCRACQPTRIRVTDFSPDRRFRRIMARNKNLHVSYEKACLDEEYYLLYERYIRHRHKNGDMFPPSEEQFEQFLLNRWADTRFVCFRHKDRLLAVAVTDHLEDGLSAVYCFFDPDETHLSLGTHAILWQIMECQRLKLPYLYLGYLIRDCSKMAYKASFQPLEILTERGWQLSDR
jgi:arginine-tRNA-protein transferase